MLTSGWRHSLQLSLPAPPRPPPRDALVLKNSQTKPKKAQRGPRGVPSHPHPLAPRSLQSICSLALCSPTPPCPTPALAQVRRNPPLPHPDPKTARSGGNRPLPGRRKDPFEFPSALSPAAGSILNIPRLLSASPAVPSLLGAQAARRGQSWAVGGLRPGPGGLRSRRSPSCCGCCSWGCGWGCGSGWGGCESGCGCGWSCSCRSCGCGSGCTSRCSASWRTRGWAGSRGWDACGRCRWKRGS